MQYEVHEGLVSVLTDELDEGLCGELLPELVRRQPVLRECVVELFEDCIACQRLLVQALIT